MTPAVLDYIKEHAHLMVGDVLEVGAYNVNGSVRGIIPISVGIDMRPGENVDVVLPAEKLLERYPRESFDSIISTETLEHVEKWREAIINMWGVLKPNGWLLMTMACLGKNRHNHPNDYWRMPKEYVIRIFPTAIDVKEIKISLCWAAQKLGPLPDLSKIELIPVDEVKK